MLASDAYDEVADHINVADWYFPIQPGGEITVDLTALTDASKQLARWALDAWESVANLTFREVEKDAKITFYDEFPGGWSDYVKADGGGFISSEVNVGQTMLRLYGDGLGSETFMIYIHEIGHALGLEHPGDYKGYGIYGVDSLYKADSIQVSAMSYFNQNENTDIDASFAMSVTPMMADILAIQEKYGAPETNPGDTVYGYQSNVGGYLGQVFAAVTEQEGEIDGPVTLTLFDSGGEDRLDLRTDEADQRVDLRPEGVSDVYGLTGNWLIARGTVIENLVAGQGDDQVIANAAANKLDGGPGSDVVLYVGSDAGVRVDLDAGTGAGGHAEGDTLVNFEHVVGSAHDDRLRGDNNANHLWARAGDDKLVGFSGDDRLYGEAGDDRLYGSGGDDVLEGGAGADRVAGGGGNDTASYADSNAGVRVDLRTGAASGGHAEGDTLNSIENIIGSAHDDEFLGDADANRLAGGAGADTLDGGAGRDTVSYADSDAGVRVDLDRAVVSGGHAEGDTLNNIENVIGSAHDDELRGAAGANTLEGGAGNDTVSYAGSDAGVQVDLDAGTGAGGHAASDVLTGIENVIGSVHDDELRGDSGANRLAGGAGADTLEGGAGNDTASYAGSNAMVRVDLDAGTGVGGHAAGDTLTDIENVIGSVYDDELRGDSGVNRLAGGAGADTLYGGAGNDTVSYASSDAGVRVGLDTGTGAGGHAAGDTLTGIENVIGSAHDDELRGDSGVNRLAGAGGNDVLEGGDGADTLDGGAGRDTVSYAGSDAGVQVDLRSGTVSGGHATGDTLIGIEKVIGSAYEDELRSNHSGNDIRGGAGNDKLVGLSGSDILYGEAGDDWLYGGGMNDVLHGGAGADELHGADGHDMLWGGAGADTLEGGAGADKLYGGARADTFVYTAASDSTAANTDRIPDFSGAGGEGDRLDLSGLGSGLGFIGTAGFTRTAGEVRYVWRGADTDSNARDDYTDVLADLDGDGTADFMVTLFGLHTLEGADLVGVYVSVSLVGTVTADELRGGDGDDTLRGEGGDDVLEGGAGADTLYGGAGSDTVSYVSSEAGVRVDLGAGAASGGHAAGDTFNGIENLIGSAHNDELRGDNNANALWGRAGDDKLEGLSGDDRLYGEAGADRLYGSGGDDVLEGGAGADTLDGGAGTDTVSYADSDAPVQVNLGTGAVSGGHAAGDTLTSIENVTGSAHGDALQGDAGANRLVGAGGEDTLEGGGDADTLDGGGGSDTVSYADSDAAVWVNLGTGTVSGGHATGDTLNNIENIIGSVHDDKLRGAAGANTLDGGGGSDTVSYADSDAAVRVNLDAGTGAGGHAEGDALNNIENIIGSAYDDELQGDAGANHRLSGEGGSDVLEGGGGADTLDGGAGADTFVYTAASDSTATNTDRILDFSGAGGEGDRLDLSGLGNGLGFIGTAGFTGTAGEVRYVLSGADTDSNARDDYTDVLADLDGDGTVDFMVTLFGLHTLEVADFVGVQVRDVNAPLVGTPAADELRGGDGDDTLRGEGGDDVLEGGDGADTLDGGTGSDTVSYAGSDAGVRVDLDTGAVSGGHAVGDTLSSIENVIGSAYDDELRGDNNANALWGRAGDDKLVGLSGDDRLYGEAGADRLYGSGGNDVLEGGAGADVLHGEGGNDSVSYSSSNAGVQVDLGSGAVSGGHAAGDTLRSIENVIGSAHDDALQGAAGANRLVGAGGDDTLEGGGDADTLDGGAGADSFVYNAASASTTANTDYILDFSGAGGDGDRLDLSGLGNDLVFIGTEDFTDTAGEVRYVRRGANTGSNTNDDYTDVLADLNGNGAANFKVTLDGLHTLEVADFVGVQVRDVNAPLVGTPAADELRGGDGDDTLRGEGGDDVLEGGAGADTLDGGGGTDTASYADSDAPVQVNLGNGAVSGGHAAGDTLNSIENVIGSAYDDELRGDAGANRLTGEAGADRLYGSGGHDVLAGGAGDDVLHGQGGADVLQGGAGDDELHGQGWNDLIEGGAGADTLDGGAGSDTVSYRSSNAAVQVDLGTGTVSGGHATGDTLSRIENVTGSRHDDELQGAAGANRLAGAGGNDTLEGGAGADTLDGGAGTDTVSYAGSDAPVQVNLGGSAVSGGHAAGDTLRSIENLIGSAHDDALQGAAGDNWLVGGGGDDTLEGGDGADTLDGGAGADSFVYNAASASTTANTDYILDFSGAGGDGDRLDLSGLGNGLVFIGTEDFTDTAGEVRYVRRGANTGSNTNDDYTDVLADLNGNGAANFKVTLDGLHTPEVADFVGVQVRDVNAPLVGTPAADELRGGDGDDTLRGEGGDDVLEGGAGADTLDGGGGSDTVSYADSDAPVQVNLGNGAVSGGHAAGDTLTSIENVIGSAYDDELRGDAGANRLTGEAGADRLYGSGGHDVLAGGAGDDVLHGQGGADVLQGGAGDDELHGQGWNDLIEGGAGADTLDGGAGSDTVSYRSSNAAVQVDLGTGTVSGGHAAGDTLRSIENLIGSAHDDALQGAAGDNWLVGGGGDDTLEGGDGADTLDGGAGADSFVYNAASASTTANTDYILDFSGAGGDGDRLDLSGLGNGLVFIGTEDFTGTAGEVRYVRRGANTGSNTNDDYTDVLADLNGDGAADFKVTLDGLHTLEVADLVGVQIREVREVREVRDVNAPLVGTPAADELRGGDGDDTLRGEGGDDVLEGGDGADTLDGGGGSDTVSYAGSGAGVRVDLGNGAVSGGHAAGDTFNSIENVIGSAYDDELRGDNNANALWGRAGDDKLVGLSGDDRLYGEAGADQLYGSGGNDVLEGGAGADVLHGEGGNDSVSYRSSNAGVRVNLGAGTVSGGHAEGDSLGSIENVIGSAYDDELLGNHNANAIWGGAGKDKLEGLSGDDRLYGEAGADQLYGSRGNDVLEGGDGDDRVRGGSGSDRLSGGTGADTFMYGAGSDSTAANTDQILDFSGAGGNTDRLDLSGLGSGLVFVGTQGFSDTAGEVRYAQRGADTGADASDDFTDVLADLDGDGTADFMVSLTGLHSLSDTDFIV